MPETARRLAPPLPETKDVSLGCGRPKAINQGMFEILIPDDTHMALVNKYWGGERGGLLFKGAPSASRGEARP